MGARENKSYMRTQSGIIEYRVGDAQSPRGLVIATASTDYSKRGTASVCFEATLPHHWRTITQWTDPGGAVDMIVVGHMYARDARSFDVTESLDILAPAFKRGGMTEVQNAIGGGMFTLFIVDHAGSTIYAVCDLLACMPLFYKKMPDGAVLATNQFDLQSKGKVCSAGCIEYLQYGYLPFTSSLIQDVERLGPGQVLTLNSNKGRINVTGERCPAYPPLHERISDTDEACERLDELFTRYFARLDDEPIAVGLSGGYDSRLIAAYTTGKNRRLVTFGNPGTAEADTAGSVAAALNTTTQLFAVPADAPSRYLADFRYGMQTLDNLEMSHVFGILDALLQCEPKILIDGFLGDVILGSGYYYKLTGEINPLWRVLTRTDTYEEPRRPVESYIDRALKAYGRVISISDNNESNEYNVAARREVVRQINQLATGCYTHADMLEMLYYRLRGRCVIAGGPITFLRHAPTLCPFYDEDIFRLCMSIDKNSRAGDRLYNAFWRNRFPQLAGIPKESTGGRPSQGDVGYRCTNFCVALRRRVAARLPKRIRWHAKAGGDTDDLTTMYVQCSANKALFEKARDVQLGEKVPLLGDAISGDTRTDAMNKSLLIRAASLGAQLDAE